MPLDSLIKMKARNLLPLIIFSLLTQFVFGQNWVIEQTRIKDGKTNRIKAGDKVLISFKQLNSEAISRPNSVFINSTDIGYTRTVLKARITSINENTIEIKDLSVKGKRAILFDKIDGIRRLSTGKQILRATSQVVGFVGYGLGFAYIHENFWTAMSFWVGGSSLLALGSTDFHTKYETGWRYKIVRE